MTKLRLLLLLVLVTALLAGCGGSSSSSSTPTVRVTDATVVTTEATNVKATGGPEQVNLSWEAASTTNLLGWLVEYSVAGSGVWTKAPQLAPSSLTDALKLKPASYELRVWAIVKQAPATATATSEEAPTPPPPPPPSGFLPGLNAGYWGSGEYSDLHTLAAGHPFVVRLENPPALTPWEQTAGVKVDALENHYSTSGVSGLNHGEFVAKVVNFVKANPRVYSIEVLNEPGGSWFWGGSSESSANRESYGHLLIEVHNALVSNFGSARPLELCSWDGGHDSSNAWGEAWSKVSGSLAACDGVTSHPYGGTGTRKPTTESGGIYGNRNLVKGAHEHSGKPVYVTEVGWPTQEQTGDSLKYSETESAWALYHFYEWAAKTGYVSGVDFYGYRGDNYGVLTHAGARKKSYTALQQFDSFQPCGVCS